MAGRIVVANAPISYGAFELTVGIDPSVPGGEHVLDEVASAGYGGIDLGPVGFLGRGPELAARLNARGLGLDRKSTRLNSSHIQKSRMPSSA